MTTTVSKPCPFCGTFTSLTVDSAALAKREAGALIQDAFPNLSADDREFLITGMCRPCQGDVFEGEEA